MAFGYNK